MRAGTGYLNIPDYGLQHMQKVRGVIYGRRDAQLAQKPERK
jgi:hypothetical protein